MRRLVPALLCGLVLCAAAPAQREFYLTTNILSPGAGIPVGNSTVFALWPLISNLEYGVNLNAGFVGEGELVEARFTLGKSNSYNLIPQLHLGYAAFPFEKIQGRENGWYTGGFVRYWDYINIATGVHNQNAGLEFALGHMWKKSRLLVDLRLNQGSLLLSWSSVEGSIPSADFVLSPVPMLVPVLPFFCLNVGWRL